MRQLRRWLLTLAPVAGLGLLTLSGCGGGDKPTPAPAPAPKAGAGKSGGGPKQEAKAVGYAAAIKGRVTYNGDAKPEVKMLKPTKDADKCPAQVPAEGWYVNEANKGVRYALVFLMPPKGYKMPAAAPQLDNPDKPEVEMGQPKCQFEPRVLALHPKQKLKVKNDSEPGIQHDSNIQSSINTIQKSLPPGGAAVYELEASDKEPNKVACGIHAGVMSAYVWKMTHPYAVVTDADGNFEIKLPPVPEGGKMILAVWHEMLPVDGNNVKEIGELDLKPNETLTKDIAIPK